ncbi:hypothetical protein [Glycomyces sp. NPDC047010]|uniref:hypothetical protein n=1 Tax=Glycomyces sp. NPDC047010 TaxID=3155023 RepID=UPI0033D4A61B
MAHPSEPSTTLITVRNRRRLLIWMVAVCWPLTPASFALGIYLLARFDVESRLLLGALLYSPMLGAVFGTVALIVGRNLLTYDVGRQQIRSVINCPPWREGDRLEYSIYRGRLELVRASGRRRSVVGNSFLMDKDSWAAFVDVFLAHHHPRAGRADPSSVVAESAVKVGIRWRFFTGFMLVGLAMELLNVLFWLDTPDNYDPFGPLPFAGLAYILFGLLPLILRPVLIYEDGRVSLKSLGRSAREFPSAGYERLEYSVYWGCLFEVRADGKRRRVARGWARDQDTWKAFVDRFLEDLRPVAPASAEAES